MALIPNIPTSAFPPVNNLELSQTTMTTATTTTAKSSSGSATSASAISIPKSTPAASKKWVLPPRPKPGRKSPSTGTVNTVNTNANTSTNNIPRLVDRSNSISTSISHLRINSPSPMTPDSLSPPTPILTTSGAKTSLASTTTPNKIPVMPNTTSNKPSNNINSTSAPVKATARMVEIDSEIVHNPVKQNILKINEENYYLKLEVIRLVSNLKSLRDDIGVLNNSSNANTNKSATPKNKITNTDSTNNTINKDHEITNNDQSHELIDKSDQKPKKKIKRKTKPVTTATTTTPTIPTKTSIPSTLPVKLPHSNSLLQTEVSEMISTPIQNSYIPNSVVSNSPQNQLIPESQQQLQPHSKKRTHDDTNNDQITNNDDIDNLIVSLVDLTHTQNSSLMTPDQSQITALTQTGNSNSNSNSNSNLNSIAIANPVSSQQMSFFQHNDLSSDPTLFDLDDDVDLLSTVSTTPSTMFSFPLSISTTNDIHTPLMSSTVPLPTMQYIHEQPTFDLLDLPTDDNILDGRMDIKMNYELDDIDMKLPSLNTFDTLNTLDYESSFLMETVDMDRNLNGSNEGVSSNSLELLNFGTNEDVDVEFSKFVSGERSM